MVIEPLFDTGKQIKEWKAREDLLTDWIEQNTSHPDFENKYRELMQIKQKLRALRQRHYRRFKKNSGLEVISIPIIRK